MLPFLRRPVHAPAILFAWLVMSACDSTTPKENPLPSLTDVSPDTVAVGTSGVKLTLSGTGFAREARVRWNQEDRPTTYVSPTQVTVDLAASDLASAAVGKVTVVNPAPGGGSSGELSVHVLYGVPVLTSISPSRATALSTDSIEITATGSGFISQSRILWNGFAPSVTRYVSPTQLTVRVGPNLLSTAGTVKISVANPAPGGGRSATQDFAVENPAAKITMLSPDSAFHGGSGFTLTVHGEKFARGAVVRWNGSDRATTYVSATQLRAAISGSDIATPGDASVVVANPAPAEGPSAPATFRVKEAPPRISSLSPSSAAPGGAAFTLTVSGSNFQPSSVVLWNGTARTTEYVSSTTLRAGIGSADLAQAGTAQVQVRNPAPSGTSTGYAFPILASGAQITSQLSVPLKSNHIVYDARRNRIYASVPSTVSTRGNTITAVDPSTGQLLASVFVGSEPNRLAISDDGSYLYVTLNGASSVVRVGLDSFTRDLEIALPTNAHYTILGEDIEAIPGSPRSFAVSLRNTCCSPRHMGVAIYDDAVRRANTTQGHTGSNRIAVTASAPGYLYGYNNETTEFGFRRIAITASGLREEMVVSGISGFGMDIEADGDRVFSSSGIVMDVGTMARAGAIPASGIVRPDAKNGRVHYFSGTTLSTYHVNAFTSFGTLSIPAASGAGTMIRWGTDGLALRTADAIVLVRSPLVGS